MQTVRVASPDIYGDIKVPDFTFLILQLLLLCMNKFLITVLKIPLSSCQCYLKKYWMLSQIFFFFWKMLCLWGACISFMPMPVTYFHSFMLWIVLSCLLCIVLVSVTYCLFYPFYLHLLGSSVGWTLNYFLSFIFLTLRFLSDVFPFTVPWCIVPCRTLLVAMFIYFPIVFIRSLPL